MKHILAASALCAVPTAAFAQHVACQACDHVAPYYRGVGGFIGTVAEGAEEVVFVASCGSASTTGEARIHGGTASQLFDRDNGLACDMEGGSLEIAGLDDGGWYWITDASNSAVGNLVPKDILGNEATDITGAGPGVTMTMGRGAVFLKEVSTGRVGILPNILPAPPEADPPPATLCGAGARGAVPGPASPGARTNCLLGNGETKLVVIGPTGYTTGPVDSVVRPYTGAVSFTVSARLDTTKGIYATDTTNAVLGRGTTPLTIDGWETETVEVDGDGPGTTRNLGTVGVTTQDGDNNRTYTVAPNTTFCGTAEAPLSHTVSVTITPTVADSIKTGFVPALKDYDAADGNQIASTTVSIRCPSGAASPTQGIELVPENPFPVDE